MYIINFTLRNRDLKVTATNNVHNSSFLTFLFESLFKIIDEFLHGLLFVWAVEFEFELASLRGRERHDTDDRLSINTEPLFDYEKFGIELAGKFYDGGGGACVQACAVLNSNGPSDHEKIILW